MTATLNLTLHASAENREGFADRTDIVVIGSYNRDISVVVDQFPRPGETRPGSDCIESHGGKGSNQAIQAARCGARVAMIACLGADQAGQSALDLWRSEGIDPRWSRTVEDCGTGIAIILVDGAGQNVIVTGAGANARLTPSVVRDAARLVSGAALVVAQRETPDAATVAAFEMARRGNAVTLLNAAPARAPVDPALLPLTDILIVNEIEARDLAEEAAGDVLILGRRLLAKVGLCVAITLGAEGAVLFEKDAEPHRQPAPKVAVLDTTGAGDALIGAFAARWAATQNTRDALLWGVVAGSLACTRRGAVESLPGSHLIAEAVKR